MSLSTVAKEKLDRINSLLASISECEAELETILGGEVEQKQIVFETRVACIEHYLDQGDLTPREVATKVNEAGWDKVTVHDVYQVVAKRKKQKRGPASAIKQRNCGRCGKPGHRSDTCGDVKEEDELDLENFKVSESLFSGVKKLQDLEYSSKEVSEKVHLPIGVVNKIFPLPKYEDFKKYHPKLTI